MKSTTEVESVLVVTNLKKLMFLEFYDVFGVFLNMIYP